jgi:hypothetical protein
MCETEGDVVDNLSLLEGQESLVVAARREQAFIILGSMCGMGMIFILLMTPILPVPPIGHIGTFANFAAPDKPQLPSHRGKDPITARAAIDYSMGNRKRLGFRIRYAKGATIKQLAKTC